MMRTLDSILGQSAQFGATSATFNSAELLRTSMSHRLRPERPAGESLVSTARALKAGFCRWLYMRSDQGDYQRTRVIGTSSHGHEVVIGEDSALAILLYDRFWLGSFSTRC